MHVLFTEKVRGSSTDELRIKQASWDASDLSLKYAWPDKNGKIARGGELPVACVPQSIEMLVRYGVVDPAEILEAVTKGMRGSASPAQVAA